VGTLPCRPDGCPLLPGHHLSPTVHGGDNLVIHIRYDEHLRKGDDDVWRHTDRGVLIDWMDRRLAHVVGGILGS